MSAAILPPTAVAADGASDILNVVLLALLSMALMKPDIVLADFEGATYGGWTVTGTAFGTGPAEGTLPRQMPVTGYRGRRLANSYVGGDESLGTLESPEFKIEHAYLSFLIGGGHDPERLRLELVVDGVSVRLSTGPNRSPGGSEALHPDAWDLRPFRGKRAILRITDRAQGGWGHLCVDHLVLTDKRPPMSIPNPSRSWRLERRFVHIPIAHGAPMRRLTVQVEGEPAVTNDVALADGAPEYYTSLDISAWKGRKLTLTVDQLPEGSKAFQGVLHQDEVPGKSALYDEPLRGQIRFSPRSGWTNDPNGLVYYRGEHHLFFQHNPYGWGWGNMHWGHAVSRDLVHWEELPIALFPDRFGTMFSGSAVVDNANTSGLGGKNTPPMVLFYTAAGSPSVQGLAWSLDGRRFTRLPEPIVGAIGKEDRDPKVIWHEPTGSWIMALYLALEKPTIQFLGSKDLKSWTPLSRIEGYHECPDLFELPIEGRPGESKWVLTAANSDYQVGTFDGREFKPETPILKGHRGRGFYAAQTFSDVPGKRIQIGWFQTETRGMAFNQSMSIPMELRLVADADGPRLTWTPVRELEALRVQRWEGPRLEPGSTNPFEDASCELAELEASLVPSPDARLSLRLRGVEWTYDAKESTISVDGIVAPAPLIDGLLKLRIFVDRVGFEGFVGDGRTFIPLPKAPDPKDKTFKINLERGTMEVEELVLHRLRSIWRR